MPFIVVMDKSKNLLGQFQAFAVPSLYLINKKGNIVFTHSGYMPGDEKKLEAALSPLFQKEEKKEESTQKKEG
jgi:thioredoxin-related protein